MIPLPEIGSLADLGTLIVVLYVYRADLRPRLATMSAGIVALARGRPHVDDDGLQSDLDIPDRHVADYQRPIADGPEGGSHE